MGFVEISPTSSKPTLAQNWSHILTLLLAGVLFVAGLNLRQSILTATNTYSDNRVGISAQYPADWLLDTDSDEYVFRVRDMRQQGFKTTLQVQVEPVGPSTTERNIADRLALTRSLTLIDYNHRPIQPFSLQEPNDSQSVTYTYVAREASPLLQGIPQVVLGQDIIILRSGQAVIITFRSEATRFEQESRYLQPFLEGLEF